MNVVGIIALIVLFIAMAAFVAWFFSKESVLTGKQDASVQKTIVSEKIEAGTNTSFAFSIWVYIGDWSLYSGTEKVVYSIGNSMSPDLKVSLDKTSPTLLIDTQDIFDLVTVTDMPLQSWVCITISLNGSSLDVYINGKLVKTAIAKDGASAFSFTNNTAILSPGINASDGEDGVGFGGYTSRFTYWSSSLTPGEVWNIYSKGPGGTILGNILGERGISVNLLNGNDVTRSFNLI